MAASSTSAILKAGTAYELSFIADGTGAFTPLTIQVVGDIFTSIAIEYGTPAPDALAITVKDKYTIDLLGSLGGVITASERIDVIPPTIFNGELTVALTGNSTAGAVVTVGLFFL